MKILVPGYSPTLKAEMKLGPRGRQLFLYYDDAGAQRQGERQRETERETESDRERQRETERDSKEHRERQRYTGREAVRKKESKNIDIYIYILVILR